MIAQLGATEGLLTMLTERIDSELLDAAKRLRVISQMAVGVDNIDLDECASRGIAVGHTPDVLTETTADTAWALLSASVRRVSEAADHVRTREWGPWDPELLLGDDLWGSTLGIVGLGRIGQAVARRARGYSMRVLYTGPSRKPHAEAGLGVIYRTFQGLIHESDHVVLTCPLTVDTYHLIDAGVLERMKPGATLVNIARGGLVDHEALADALTNGTIARAALDVTEPEPIPDDHRLIDLPNCLIVPHIGSASVATRKRMALMAVENLHRGLRGEHLLASVDLSIKSQLTSQRGNKA